ncbi:MAG: 50S ribosomal protein L22 [Candidatus Omnitrophota bacterium]|jgi:large subunit ribosomal protein L22
MISKAILRYIRITPRKFRLILPLIKGKNPEEAIQILRAVKRGASKHAIDMLTSAIANAKRNDQGIDVSTLYISKMTADPGPTLKRFRAGSMGRASTIRKRTSHLTVELDQRKQEGHKAHDHSTAKRSLPHGDKVKHVEEKKTKKVNEEGKAKDLVKGKK